MIRITIPAGMLLQGRCSTNAKGEACVLWQQFGAAHIARPVRGRLLPAPKHWQRLIVSLSFEIAELLDVDCGWGCTVERVSGGKCLVYRPQRWAIRGDTGATFDALDTAPVAGDVAGRTVRPITVERSG